MARRYGQIRHERKEKFAWRRVRELQSLEASITESEALRTLDVEIKHPVEADHDQFLSRAAVKKRWKSSPSDQLIIQWLVLCLAVMLRVGD